MMISIKVATFICRRQLSSATKRQTVVCRNGVVAAWHPPKDFPYEHSRPIVLDSTEEKSSVLSDRSVSARSRAYQPSNNDLKNIFYTDKHEWFTRTREERLRSVAAPRPKRK